MAQLFFKFGTMNSGKSIDLIKTAYSYDQNNKKVLILKSSLDTRSGNDLVKSRMNMSVKAISIYPNQNILKTIMVQDIQNVHCILIDEAQFLSKEQILELTKIVDLYHKPVICYGLKTDFQGNLFEGAKALLEYADKCEEIKSICCFCDKKATMNLRTIDGHPVYDGNVVQIGDKEYLSVCRNHYFHPKTINKMVAC